MKKYYNVSFWYSENVACANIAYAENKEAVIQHYSQNGFTIIGSITEASAFDVYDARKRNKPIVNIN